MGLRKKSICILSFSPIYRDARVLRQIRYLSPHYDLMVIGYGPPHPDWKENLNIKWISLNPSEKIRGRREESIQTLIERFDRALPMKFVKFLIRKLSLFISFSLLFLGRLNPFFFHFWYWRYWKRGEHLKVLDLIIQTHCDAIHANDWEALPVAFEVESMNNAKVVFDSHEYAPLELENRRYWKIFFQPAIIYFIKKYASRIKASVTVAPLISKCYKNEFGFDPIVLLNTPEEVSLPLKKLDANHITLVHHGGAIRDRKLEEMIETLALCDQRFSLHFLLLDNDPKYLHELKNLAKKRAPGRILFHNPVPPDQIVIRISEFDIGFCLIAPTNFNYLVSLPNKFFDYVMAGLALCIGPSPSMAEMVSQYGFGCVAPSFEPHDVAKTLNRLTIEDLSKMKLASREVAKYINAKEEMKKLVEIYHRLLGSNGASLEKN